ncbi:MAG: hypothetical protein GKS06_05380 [Acidobacteria bacterium]|nr:hypothetical protein [Acidobacteriota bacterium]
MNTPAPVTRLRRIVLVLLTVGVLTSSGVALAQIPTPESILGFRVGDDFKLATYDESLAYFEALAASSDLVQLVPVGQTSEGRDWYMALISTPENLARVEEYRQIAQRLAAPAGLSDAEARDLAARGKALVHIDGGLHATEVAHAQHTIQLAYDLVIGAGDPATAAILDEVILMLWPSVNPDGQNMVVDWYRGNVGGPYEVASLPWLYQKYVGHDNNRDGYMLNMIESRVLARTWRHWEPQIIYVHHQSSPFPTRIWLPPFAEPIATQVHPLMSRTVNAIGMLIARSLEERGQPGATHMGGFDAWYPGYVDYTPMLRNIAAWWTETALYRYATPGYYTLRDFPPNARDLRPESLYSSPWEGGWWRLRDAVDYMLTASVATLDYASKYRFELLYNRYQAGRDTAEKYREEPPYAYFVPQDQRDPVAAVEMLRRLAFSGIRIGQLTSPVRQESMDYPVGTWVIPMDQEMAELAAQVLEVQVYPDLREYPEGPPEQPYDAAGWTLPYQMGVQVVAASQPLSPEVRDAVTMLTADTVGWQDRGVTNAEEAEALDIAKFDSAPGIGFDTDPVAAAIVPPPGRVTGSGSALALDPGQNNAFRAVNRAWANGGTVRFVGGESPRYVVSGLSTAAQDALVEELSLQAERSDQAGVEITKPRAGLYRPWTASIDEGWTRWTLERYEFDFVSVYDADIRAGRLIDRYDVIVLPDTRAGPIVAGHAPGTIPARFTGGIGEDGVRALDNFVREGGTLVALNSSAALPIDRFNLQVENVVGDLGRDEFFTGISLLQVEPQAHPVMAGMPSRASVTASRSPVWQLPEDAPGQVLMRYPTAGDPLLSGYLLGAEHLHGHAAALSIPHGDGQVIMFGFRPQWRGQPFGTFRVLFNALLVGGLTSP